MVIIICQNCIIRIKNLCVKFNFKQKLYKNTCNLYIENYNKNTISYIISKYAVLSDLISIVYLNCDEKKIIFFIIKKILSTEIVNILEIFFYDTCSKCILKKNIKANYLVNNDRDLSKNNEKTNNKIILDHISTFIDLIIFMFFLIIRLPKFILKTQLTDTKNAIYHY